MTPQARDGAGSPLPSVPELMLKAQYLAVDYRMAKGAKNTVEAQLVHTIICLKQATSDFSLRAFCDENDLHYTTLSPYVSDLEKFNMQKRLAIDPQFKMPVTGWRYLVQAMRKGLPENMAFDVAQDYIEASETGVYNELGLMDATLENMRERAFLLAQNFSDGNEADVLRKKYPVSEHRHSGAKIRRTLQEYGYEDLAAIDENKFNYRVAITVIEEVDE